MSRLFVSDLDGTLVDAEGRLTPFARKSLEQLLCAGLKFTIASARSATTLRAILGDLPLNLPVVEFNGAYITDLRTSESLFCEALEPHIAQQVLEWGSAQGLPPFLSTYGDGRQRLYPPHMIANPGMQWFLDERHKAKDLRLQAPRLSSHVPAEAAVCITFVGRLPELMPIRNQVEATFSGATNSLLFPNHYHPGWHWLTVQSAKANKGRALAALAKITETPLSDVTVFGDEANDLAMFDVAGHAVAVGNALESVKAKADEVIAPHTEDSVVHYLLRAAQVF